MARPEALCHDLPMQRTRLTISKALVQGSTSKLFQVLVVGGLSLAATEGCSSAPAGGNDSSAAEDAMGPGAPDGSPSDAGTADDVATKGDGASQGDVAMHDASAGDSATTEGAMTDDACIPFDARVDFPNEAGFCAHGLCAW
jgi:hypothetical protein